MGRCKAKAVAVLVQVGFARRQSGNVGKKGTRNIKGVPRRPFLPHLSRKSSCFQFGTLISECNLHCLSTRVVFAVSSSSK